MPPRILEYPCVRNLMDHQVAVISERFIDGDWICHFQGLGYRRTIQGAGGVGSVASSCRFSPVHNSVFQIAFVLVKDVQVHARFTLYRHCLSSVFG